MICIGASVLLNTKYGPANKHYGLALLSAIFGGFIALRQIAFHACPNFPQFGVPFWGLGLYTWSFIVFASTVGVNALLLFCFKNKKLVTPMNWFGHLAFWLLIIVSL